MDNSKQAKTFYVRDILAIMWKRKWLVAIPVVIASIITVVSTFYLTPVFESSVTIFMEKPVRLSPDLQRLVGSGGLNIGANPETQAQELQSLQNEIVSAPYIAQLVQRMGMDKEMWIEVAARKQQVAQPNMSLEELKFDILLSSLRNRIQVVFAGINQVRVIVQSSNPDQAKMIAENLGDIFIQEKTKQESKTITASSDFSSDQLTTFERDLQTKINEKTNLEKEQVRIELDELVASEENRRQINLEIQGVALEIGEKEKVVSDAQLKLANLSGGIPTLEETQVIKDKRTEISRLLGSMSDLMQTYNWNAPSLVSFKVRLYGLAGDVDEEVAQIVRQAYPQESEIVKNGLITVFAARLRLETLYAYSNKLTVALADLNRRVGLMPEYRAKIEQLTREIEALRSLRDQFKSSQRGTEISQALLMESKLRVVEPARVPLSPKGPDKRMIMILGFFLGLGLGAGAVVIAEFFDNSIKKIEDAELALGYSVVGTMPKIEGLEKLKLSPGR